MENTAETKPRRRVLLIASLCLNLFLVGVIAAGLFAAWQREAFGIGAGPGSSPFHPRNIAAMLPPDGKAKVEKITRDNRLKFVPLLRDVRSTRLDAFRQLQQEPFDQAKFDIAMNNVRNADAKLAEEGQRIVLEIMASLTPEERRIVVEKIRSRRWSRDVEKNTEPDQ